MQLLLQYWSLFYVSWKPQLLCTSIRNQFDSIRTVQIGLTTKTFGPSRIPSQVSHRAAGRTAGVKDSADMAGMAPAMQTWSGSSQCTCLTDRADWRHSLAIQNVSVSHQPQHILSLLISNIPARVSAERIKLFSPCSLPVPFLAQGEMFSPGCSWAGPGNEAALFLLDCTSSRGGFCLWDSLPWLKRHPDSNPCRAALKVISLTCSRGMETECCLQQELVFFQLRTKGLISQLSVVNHRIFLSVKAGELFVLSPIYCSLVA